MNNEQQIKTRLNEVNLKIINLENKIRSAKGELEDFRKEKLWLEAQLQEVTNVQQV